MLLSVFPPDKKRTVWLFFFLQKVSSFPLEAGRICDKKMAITLRVALSSLTCLVAAVTVIVSFTPTYFEGVHTVNSVFSQYSEVLKLHIQQTITNFFAGPPRTLREVSAVFNRGAVNVSHHDWNEIRQITCPVVYPPRPNGYTGFNVGLEDGFFVTCSLNQLSSGGTGVLGSRIRLESIVNGTTVIYAVSGPINTTTFVFDVPPPAVLTPYDHRLRPFYDPVFASSGPVTWTPLFITSQTPAISAGIPLFDAISNKKLGVLVAEFHSVFLSSFLRSLRLGKTGRGMIVHENSSVIIGISWYENITVLNQAGLPDFKYPENVTDPLMSLVVHSGNIMGRDINSSYTVGSGEDKIDVEIFPIQDEFGLLLRVILALPEKDELESIYKSRVAVSISVTVLTAFFLIIAFLLSYFAFSPLQALCERMELCSTFHDVDPREPLSLLDDVAQMQKSYYELRKKLNSLKCFMPQSLLAEEREEDHSDLKPIACSSTSIEESTVAQERLERSKNALLQAHEKVLKYNISEVLRHKPCAVLTLNVRGFHALLKTSPEGMEALARYHKELTTMICAAAVGGVIDGFRGDRFCATFNAVVACPKYCVKAGVAALRILEGVRTSTTSLSSTQLNIGISSGMALVGNLGDHMLKRFTVVGSVYTEAIRLQETCRSHPNVVSCLVSASIAKELAQCSYLYALGRLKFSHGTDSFCSLVCGIEQQISEEWMYQLNPFTAFNEVFDEYVATNCISKAEQALTVIEAQLPVLPEKYSNHLTYACVNLRKMMNIGPSGDCRN